MAANLLDTIRRALPANFTELASKLVGESPGATQTAVTAALPVLVAAIAHKGAATQGAETLLPLET